jgi:SM-20-related protein
MSTTCTEPVLEILDDLVPAALFAAACQAVSGKGWYFGHSSHDTDWGRFWKLDLDGVPAFDALWEHVRARCEALAGGPLRVIRQYANGHTYGLGGQPHVDEARPGFFTLLYYPMAEWKPGWDGETVFYDDAGESSLAVTPKPNRALFFDSRIVHAGRAPSRLCPALRITAAFKLERVTPLEASTATGAPVSSPAARPEPTPEVAASERCDELQIEEIERAGARRVYRVRAAGAVVAERVQARLDERAATIRLPGFRPGAIPASVIQSRYGARARSDALAALAAQAADGLLARGGLASSIELVSGSESESADFECRLCVTHLPDLPAVDFAALKLERLIAPEPDLSAALDDHLRQQVLDYLDAAYRFPLAPPLIERELALIKSDPEVRRDVESLSPEERRSWDEDLRPIAERRVRLGAVVAELARRHGLRATEDDLRQSPGPSPSAPAETRARLAQLTEQKVIAFLVAHAQITERPATAAEQCALRSGGL